MLAKHRDESGTPWPWGIPKGQVPSHDFIWTQVPKRLHFAVNVKSDNLTT